MYLKSLDINGFKSFAEKTNISLTDKVNVVVGPNGSGKSNVVDAISWVLGTQSPASLRTNKMEDVIFAGTEKLSQKGFAEVYLNFEVDPEKFNGTTEISIGRKLFRDGTSEYFMNGLNCRLLDIQEFLSDVGIGKQQHIIISQGQIAEILNSKPEDHRVTIEEASGILPLRIKNDKSLKRIESGEKEIKRAKDVLREIKKQLKPLQDQAEQAKLHSEFTEQLKSKNLTLNVFSYKKLENSLNNISDQEIQINKEIYELENNINNLKVEKNNINSELGDGVSIGSILKDSSSKFLNISEQLRSISQIANERKDNLERDELNKSDEILRISKKINQNTDQINSLSNQLISKKNELLNLQNSYSEMKNSLEDIIKKTSASIEVNEALLQSEVTTIKAQINELNINIQQYSKDLSSWKSDFEESLNLLSEVENEFNQNNTDRYSLNNYSSHSNKIFEREIKSSNEKLSYFEESNQIKNIELEKKLELLSSLNEKEDFKADLLKHKTELENKIKLFEHEITTVSNQLASSQERIKSLITQNDELNFEKRKLSNESNDAGLKDLQNIIDASKEFIVFSNNTADTLESKSEYFDSKYGNSNKKIIEIDNQIEQLNKQVYELKDKKTNLIINKSEKQSNKQRIYSSLTNIFNLDSEQIALFDVQNVDQYSLENEIKLLNDKLDEIGVVNYLAMEDFESLNSRYEEINKTIEELNEAKLELLENIKEVEKEIIFRIESSFNSISVHFEEIFSTLFPGGNCKLSFTDKDNILNTGIEITVQPRGKKVKKLSLLSGGERSLAAIAFLFSIFKSFPSPFYILDEVEAALDDANLHRMINLLNHVKNDAQYIIVTHQQQTMHAGDVLYGVTMEPGSGSRVYTKTKEQFENILNNE